MVGSNYKSLPGLVASAAITKYKVLTITGDNAVAHADATSDVAGVAQADAATGAPVDMAERGVCIAEAGAAIQAGDNLKVDADARVIPSTETTDTRIGKALIAVSSAGDEVEILISRN